MKASRSFHDAPKILSPELLQKEAKLAPEMAQELSDAWIGLARALGEPREAAPEPSLEPAARALALEMMGKAYVFFERAGLCDERDFEKRESIEQTLPARVEAVSRGLQAMGMDARATDHLWGLAFNEKVAALTIPWKPRGFENVAARANRDARFSESVCWSIAEHVARESVASWCKEGPSARALSAAADVCRLALEDVMEVSQTGSDPERERSWMGEREASVAKAMMRIVEITAKGKLDQTPAGQKIAKNAEAFVAQSGPLERFVQASEAAAVSRRRSAQNVKTRRINPP